MHTFSAVIERCPETGLLVGYVPGFPGAHSQGETLDELQANLKEVIAMLLEDGEPALESDFVGLQQISVPAAGLNGGVNTCSQAIGGGRYPQKAGF